MFGNFPRQRQSGQRRIHRAYRREQRLITSVRVVDVVKAPVTVRHRICLVIAHPQRAGFMIGRS